MKLSDVCLCHKSTANNKDIYGWTRYAKHKWTVGRLTTDWPRAPAADDDVTFRGLDWFPIARLQVANINLLPVSQYKLSLRYHTPPLPIFEECCLVEILSHGRQSVQSLLEISSWKTGNTIRVEFTKLSPERTKQLICRQLTFGTKCQQIFRESILAHVNECIFWHRLYASGLIHWKRV